MHEQQARAGLRNRNRLAGIPGTVHVGVGLIRVGNAGSVVLTVEDDVPVPIDARANAFPTSR